MKRSILLSPTTFAFAAVLAMAGCKAATDETSQTRRLESDWTTTPIIQQALRSPQGLRLIGVTAPQGRVVLRGGEGPAFATGSDSEGRFALSISNQPTDVIFAVESQRGEQPAPAPYDLLVARDPAGPIAMLADGAPSRRLDGDGVLDSIDSDGHALVATGRAPAGAFVTVGTGEGAQIDATADAGGRWSAVLTPDGARPMTVSVGARRYAYPGPGSAPESVPGGVRAVRLEGGAGGWRAAWRLADGSWRASWFPRR